MSEQDSQSVEERKRVGWCGRNLLYGLSAPLWGASRKCLSPKRKSLKPWEIIKQANMAGSMALWSRALSGPGFAAVGTAVRIINTQHPTETFYCLTYCVHQFINSCVAEVEVIRCFGKVRNRTDILLPQVTSLFPVSYHLISLPRLQGTHLRGERGWLPWTQVHEWWDLCRCVNTRTIVSVCLSGQVNTHLFLHWLLIF